MLKFIIFLIFGATVFFGGISLLSQILYQRKIKKYNIQNYSFWIEKADTKTFKSSDRIFMPEFVIYCQFNFSYENLNYSLKIDVDRIYNQLTSNTWFHGYDTMEHVLTLSEDKKFSYYRENIFNTIGRNIDEIKLSNIKKQMENQIQNRE